MIKRFAIVLLLCMSVVAIIVVLRKNSSQRTESESTAQTPTTQNAPVVDAEQIKINGKKVVGLPPGKEKEAIKKIKVANTPSPEWEPLLEKSLRAQGGSALKEVSFNKVDSFVWAQDGIALHVESVIVTLKNDKNVETTFRVLVDAQTGKILQNWDQPIVDPANPRESFRIGIDPRYHAD